MQSIQNLNNNLRILKRYGIGCQLVLITNRKSHSGVRLVPTSMTLNGVITHILRCSPNTMALLANYVTVVENRPIMSAKYCLPVPVFHLFLRLPRHSSVAFVNDAPLHTMQHVQQPLLYFVKVIYTGD